MVNRLKDRFQEPRENGPEGDYWVVSAGFDWFYVSDETARRLLGELERRPPPRWLRFTDLFGSEVRILSRNVRRVSESTEAQRKSAREFHRAREEEEREGRNPWDEDRWW